MHSCETLPPPTPPATGPTLLLELGRLIIRSRSRSPSRAAPAHDRLLQAKLLAARPSTSGQVITQPKPESEESKPGVEAELSSHVQALWDDQIPICIEVLLAPECDKCRSRIAVEGEAFDKQHSRPRGLLLERWTMQAKPDKAHDTSTYISSQWLLNAVRSQLHFSQLSAWLATLKQRQEPPERRRKLSRESCNYKKMPTPPPSPPRSLNIVYSIKIPGEGGYSQQGGFSRPPAPHCFPPARLSHNTHLKVVLESLPRIDEIPSVTCTCRAEPAAPDELTGQLNDLTITPRCSKYPSDSINSNIGTSSRRLSIVSNPGSTEFLFTENTEKNDSEVLLDDRMHTPCSENGKHKCNCDEESDGNHRSSNSISETKKLDERRLKEIAKYKRRLRKESKMKKLCDSTSSEGDGHQKSTTTSIPILQAARFDRLRAIGCYRNQTYLTLPAGRADGRAPFVERGPRAVRSAATQTDSPACVCGAPLPTTCDACDSNRLVRSDANYDLASIDGEKEQNGRRKREDDGNALKKHKCDNPSNNITCDMKLVDNSSISDGVIKRPKLRRFFPIVDRLEKIVSDRFSQNAERDMEELHLKTDDTVFSKVSPQKTRQENKRQKTFSISEDDYVLYEKCDYGTFDRCDLESPKNDDGFKFPEPKKGQEALVPSPTEMDRFRWRFDSAASMVFHTKTGLPLTSSPAPLRRGNNCFDFDDSINGISGIKSALFHPISPPSPAVPASPASPSPAPPSPQPSPCPKQEPKLSPQQPKTKKEEPPKLRIRPSTGLLGSFEESALKGRLEPVATVHGFAAELGASGAFCPPHRRLPVTVFFYAPGGTNAPYMGHINLGPSGYRVARSGTVQVSLFNPHGTLVKMFVVLYDLTCMPPLARTFLRQRTLYMPAGAAPPPRHPHKWLRYLIHLRFMTSKSGKLYLHTDIRIIVSRKADLDTATAHSLYRPIAKSEDKETQRERDKDDRTPNRVFGGSSEFDSETKGVSEMGYEPKGATEIGYESQSYELRSFTYAPENPKYSPRAASRTTKVISSRAKFSP